MVNMMSRIETVVYDVANEYFKFLKIDSVPYLKGFCHKDRMIPLYLNNVGTIFPNQCHYHGLNTIY